MPGHLGDHGIRTKRVSVLIGNHQLLGTAQKRVSVPNGDHRVHVLLLSCSDVSDCHFPFPFE